MADMWQTDYETWLKEKGDDANMPPPFSPDMPTPAQPANNWLSRLDARLRNWLFSSKATSPGFAYLDVRGKWWSIRWSTTSFAWTAFPLGDTARDYNSEFRTTAFDPKRMFASANSSEGIVSAINARVEALRPSSASGGGGMFWLIILGLMFLNKKR